MLIYRYKIKKIYYWDFYGVLFLTNVENFVNEIKKQGNKLNKNFISNGWNIGYRHQYKKKRSGVYCLWFRIKLLESEQNRIC